MGCLACDLGNHLASPSLYFSRSQSAGFKVDETAGDAPGLPLELVVYKLFLERGVLLELKTCLPQRSYLFPEFRGREFFYENLGSLLPYSFKRSKACHIARVHHLVQLIDGIDAVLYEGLAHFVSYLGNPQRGKHFEISDPLFCHRNLDNP